MSHTTDWDAIVIGAGLAGLSCAGRLAKAGKKVVVLEQHSRPGGYWTSFSRRGFIFDVSTHWVTDPYAINRILQDLGGPTVEFVQLEHLGRYVGPPASRGRAAQPGTGVGSDPTAAIPAWDIMVGPDVEAFKKSVRASFPTVGEAALDKLVSTSVRISRVLDSLPVYSPELASPLARLKAMGKVVSHLPRLRRLGTLSAVKYFERLFPGSDLAGLRAALLTLAPIAGVPAIAPLVILGTGLRGRLYSPRGGAQVLADAFAEATVRNGVEIRYSTRATAILTEGEVVRGVLLDDRSELHAPAVVSAIDAKQTFYRLLQRDRIPASFRKALDTTPVSQSYAMVSAVITLEPATLGFDGTDVFVCPSVDVSRALESTDPAECVFLMAFPQYREPGTDRSLRALQIVAPASYSWREHWETSPTPERGAAYRALKQQWSETIVARAQEYLPRLSAHMKSVDISTPVTMYRYTLNTDGAPVGWNYTSRRRWKQRVPFLKGLYQAGHWVGPSGALWVTRSGTWAADLVLRDLPE